MQKISLRCLMFSALLTSMSTHGFAQDDIQFDDFKGQLEAKKKELADKKKALTDKLKNPAFKISGSVSVSGLANFDSEQNANPLSYVVNGNIKAELFGYSLPFSFTYSNLKLNYTNPSFKFNRMAFNPDFNKLGGHFKKLKGHFGDISSTLSPYTMSGMPYTGAGFEYAPDKWKFQILAGRFLRATPEDTASSVKPAYKRFGTGFKVAYAKEKLKLGVSAFYAIEAKNSIPTPESNKNTDIKPMENVAFAVETAFPISKELTWESEITTSVLTRDLFDRRATADNSLWTKTFTTLLFNRNASTQAYSAIKTGIIYAMSEQGTLGIAYERVDPNYKTLGGFYFTNDFENLTVNTQYRGAVNVQFSTGLQHDDLANTGKSNLNKMVVSANLSFKPTEKIDVAATYSNFQSYTFIRTPFDRINKLTPYDNLDTLNYTQLAQNASVNLNFNLKQDEKGTQNLLLLFSLVESANQRSSLISASSKFLNAGINYNRTFSASELNFSAAFNYSFSAGALVATTYGPSMSISKKLFDKKIAATISAAFNRAKSQNTTTDILNLSAGANYTHKEKHNFSFNLANQVQRISEPSTKNFRINATAAYNYNF